MLTLFPDPAKAPKPTRQKPTRWETVYRRKGGSKEWPKVGVPSVVQAGDTLTYFDADSKFTSWIVGKVFASSVLMQPMMSSGVEIRPATRVKFEDFDEVQRPVYE